MAPHEIRFSCAPLGECVVLDLEGEEAISELPRWRVRVRTSAAVDPAALVRASATLTLIDPDEAVAREVALLVTGAGAEVNRGDEHVTHLELSDPLWLLTRRSGHRIFQEASTEAIARAVIAAALPGGKVAPRLSGAYVTWPQRVQYGETDWAFLERILADDGVAAWCDTLDGAPTVILGDALRAHEVVAAVPFVGPDPARAGTRRGFSSLAWEERACHDKAWVRDFDIGQPDVYLDGKAGRTDGTFEYFEWPARVPDAAAAARRAERRLDQLRRDEIVVSGACDCIRLRVGVRFALPLDGLRRPARFAMFDRAEQEMVVMRLRHAFSRATRGAEGAPYRADAELRPALAADGKARPPVRPAIVPQPRIDQFESAVTTGPGGEEIHVDDYGRVKLRFLWDRSGIKDDRSSHWARSLQLAISAPMMLPRVGWEVVVAYLDGVPDHPFVLGRLYNATAVAPYGLPAAGASTGLQTRTTPGGAAVQEVRMSDDAGSEGYGVEAARDHTEDIGGDADTDTGVDEDHNVGASFTTHIGGSDTTKVGGPQDIVVGQESVTNVDGVTTELVLSAETISVKGNRWVLADTCYIENIFGVYGIQCNQSNTSAGGVYIRGVMGHMGLGAPLGFTESVVGARIYKCQGARTVLAAVSYSESIIGKRVFDSGTTKEIASGGVGTTAKAATLTAAATRIEAGGSMTVKGKEIVVECNTLRAGSLEIGGGKLSAKGGTTQIKGDAHRMRGGKVE